MDVFQIFKLCHPDTRKKCVPLSHFLLQTPNLYSAKKEMHCTLLIIPLRYNYEKENDR